jgi:SAM-dependent methyltransferase
MRNEQAWAPTKFVQVDRRWRASRDPKEIAIASRLIGDLTVRQYQKAIERYAAGRLVDLGCGKAPLYGIYRGKVDSVVCVDWGRSLHGTDFVDHEMDLNRPLAFADRLFDTVLATDVLEHIREPATFWSEMARICKVGGHVILGTPFLYWIHEYPHDYARYTKYSLISECQRNRLEILFLKEYGGSPEVLCDIILKRMENWAKICSMMDRISRIILALPPTKKCSKRSREKFPLGYCLVAAKTSA